MNNIEELLDLAKTQIGYQANPDNTNKYNLEYYGHESGAAWCVVFIWWLFKHTELSQLFYGGNKTASCGTLYNYYDSIGCTIKNKVPQRGDLVFFEFDGVAHCHIGICESYDGKYVTTIDGNTSETGSQSNGGQVLRRTRGKGCIWGVARPKYAPSNGTVYYTVQPGDTLSKIGKKYNMPWPLIAARNKIKSPYTIYPGQVLKIK